MIVKIFPHTSQSASFPAVSYNTGKIDKATGELMKVSGFGALQGLQRLRPEDYKNYLKMISATNKGVKYPQFHAVISEKGRVYDKHALSEIASHWLAAMGYGDQPYLLVYHKDTGNNHIHIVTTRVAPNGKKISDKYEHIRAVQQLNKLLGLDEKYSAKADISLALGYQFATKAQFMMILEAKGYALKEADDKLLVIKFGRQQGDTELALVEERLKHYLPEAQRKQQLKAWFHKYAAIYATEPVLKRNSYTSDFSEILKAKFGVELIFHAVAAKPPYGYTVIDHAAKLVLKGSGIMPLKELLAITQTANERPAAFDVELPADEKIKAERLSYYAALLKAALYNYPDLFQGLLHQGLAIIRDRHGYILHDPAEGIFIDTEELLDSTDHLVMVENFSQLSENSSEVRRQQETIPGIAIAPDVDDEAVHGRKRKKKTRTNSR